MKSFPSRLSRRERQILDVLYQKEQASVAEVLAALPDPPSYSAIRAILRTMEEKGHVRHDQERLRYVYRPAYPHAGAARQALQQVVNTFFRGSVALAVTSLLTDQEARLTAEERAELTRLIEEAQAEGR